MSEQIDVHNMQLGQRLQHYREIKGITQKQIADKAGLSKNYISSVERGVHKCSADLFIVYGTMTGISLDVLAGLPSTEDRWREIQEAWANFTPKQVEHIMDFFEVFAAGS